MAAVARWRRTAHSPAAPRCRLPAPPSAICSWCRPCRRKDRRNRAGSAAARRAGCAAERAGSRSPRDGFRPAPGARRLCARAFTSACTALTSELLPMPRAPQSSALLAGKPVGEAPRVLQQRVARRVDALQQRQRQARHIGDRDQAAMRGLPDEGVALVRVPSPPAAAGASRSSASAMRVCTVSKPPFPGLCHWLNPSICHGCNGGARSYSPRRIAPRICHCDAIFPGKPHGFLVSHHLLYRSLRFSRSCISCSSARNSSA